MSKLLPKLAWFVYHTVHTNGLVADAVYGGAYHWQAALRSFDYWRNKRNPVTQTELNENRKIDVSATLVTGVTNICNAKCTFCAYPKVVANKTLQTGVMDFEVFKKAVDEWASLGGKHLDLTPVVGDPLVDPGILQKVEYAAQRVERVSFTTNAILLNKNEMYRQIIDKGIKAIYISTQGADKEMYEKIYGVSHYDQAISGIHNLLKYNREKGEPIRIVIRFRNAQKPSAIIASPDFQEKIKPFFSEKVRINFTVDYDNWGGTIQPENMHGTMKLRRLPATLNVPCENLFGLAVRHEGSVRLCGCRLVRNDFDDLIVGNIKDNSMQEIATSDRAWKIINGFYSGQRPESCLGCTMYRPVTHSWVKRRANSHA